MYPRTSRIVFIEAGGAHMPGRTAPSVVLAAAHE
jgi:hypothetical protein